MAQVPSNWGLKNSPNLVSCVQHFRPIENNVALFGAATTITATGAGSVPQEMTITKGFHDDPAARILVLTWDPSDGTARTMTVRIAGTGQWGQTITEDVAMAQATTNATAYFTLNAFKTVTSATIIATTASSGTDTISLGIIAVAASLPAGGAGTQINGASLVRYKGFALQLPPLNSQSATAPTAATYEVGGVAITETAAAASLAEVLDRSAGFQVDGQYGVLVPATTQSWLLSGDNTANDCRAMILHIQTNRGE